MNKCQEVTDHQFLKKIANDATSSHTSFLDIGVSPYTQSREVKMNTMVFQFFNKLEF